MRVGAAERTGRPKPGGGPPLEVVVDGDVRAVPGSAERAVPAFLLLTPGRVVPASRLVDALWGEDLAARSGSFPAAPAGLVSTMDSDASTLRSVTAASMPRQGGGDEQGAGGQRLNPALPVAGMPSVGRSWGGRGDGQASLKPLANVVSSLPTCSG